MAEQDHMSDEKANPYRLIGDDAVAMQQAVLGHRSFEESGVRDTPANRGYFNACAPR